MATQDLPPPGGFGRIATERTLPRPIIRQGILFVIGCAMSWFGPCWLREWRKRYRILLVEQQEHYIAVHPFLVAEQERKFLIQLWHMREEERKVMKDHPGWKLGTLYGEKVYKTLPKDTIPDVCIHEWMKLRPTSEWHFKVMVPDLME